MVLHVDIWDMRAVGCSYQYFGTYSLVRGYSSMNCPICFKPTGGNGDDNLDRHLQDRHNFEPVHAGRIARYAVKWRKYDVEQAPVV